MNPNQSRGHQSANNSRATAVNNDVLLNTIDHQPSPAAASAALPSSAAGNTSAVMFDEYLKEDDMEGSDGRHYDGYANADVNGVLII